VANHLPPLGTLRTFEAAARRLSFTRAAEELHVTQAAVSQQIRRLEEDLGVVLFRRLPRRLLLTDEGQQYVLAVRDALAQLAAATGQIRAGAGSTRLIVSVVASLAAWWLMPRLAQFRRDHPDIEIWVRADDEAVDFTGEDVDLGIWYGRGRYRGLRSDLLIAGEIVTVCSPALLDGLRTPEDLRHQTLLHVAPSDEAGLFDWRVWLRAAGLSWIDARRGPRFSHAWLALDAARRGEGVMLVSRGIVIDDLSAGHLVVPLDIVMHETSAFYLVCPEARADHAKAATFRDWILAATAPYRDAAPTA
jgi:LysR family glycine cleavage system transcriptional activator